jgi:hypothetical protein
LATTDVIIDYCLKAIGETEVDTPTEMTRDEVLELINQVYQNDIGKRLKVLGSYTYDGSDAAHTITDGIGTLPVDFLAPAQVYDGDAPYQNPLREIFKIEDKVANDAPCSQYMLPDLTTLWIFGQTPSNTIKLYYYKKPVALTDAVTSSPTELDPLYHIGPRGIFETVIKMEYAKRNNDTYDQFDLLALYTDLLNEIEQRHTSGKKDNSIELLRDVYGGV